VPITEDVYILAAGVLAQRGMVSTPVVMGVLFAGVIVGDIFIFVIARRLGTAAYRRKLFRSLASPERRARLESLIARRGGLVVFGARFVVGLRMPSFAVAAIHGMGLARFLAWDIAAMVLSIPLVFGVGWWFSHEVQTAADGVARVRLYVLVAVAAIAVLALVVHRIRRSRAEG
jgi:membrane protein DedA with SNARE-associated domain